MKKAGRSLLGLLVVLIVGCAARQASVPLAVPPPVSEERFLAVEQRQEEQGSRLTAVERKAETAFREGRGLQENVLPRLGDVETKVEDHDERLTAIEKWRKELTGEALQLREQLKKQGQTQGSVGKIVRKGELVHGLRNITSWELAWSGNKLAAASEKKLAELQHALSDGEVLVSIVAFCGDMKAKAKCDSASQKAGVVADRLRVASSFVERQPGNESVTVAFTVRRDK